METTEENVQTVKNFFAAMGSYNKQDLLTLAAEDIEWIIPGKDETVVRKRVRYRTVGDASCTGAVVSDADTVHAIIHEVAIANVSERGATRADDKFSETAMEDRKREGYF